MSNTATAHAASIDTVPGSVDHTGRRLTTETKSALKTTELAIFALVTIGIMIAAALVGNGEGGGPDPFNAYQAAQLITALTVAYLLARGLAKSGTRERYDA